VEIASRLSSTSAAVADETLSIIADTETNQLRLPAVVCHKMQKHRLAMEGTTMHWSPSSSSSGKIRNSFIAPRMV
jgi:hypothetical protein